MQNHLKSFFTRIQPSAFLLAIQLLGMILYAATRGVPSHRALISAFGIAALLLVVWIVQHSPAVNWVAFVLGAPAVVLLVLWAITGSTTSLAWSSALLCALYFYGAGSLIAYMMSDFRVTPDELFAVGAAFTLLAWGFAYSFSACQVWAPGSFYNTVTPDQQLEFIELLFLSFTNLSTSGLSDIMPVSSWARVLLMLEQAVGVGYVAMVVSRLVGLTLQRQRTGR